MEKNQCIQCGQEIEDEYDFCSQECEEDYEAEESYVFPD